MFAAPARFLGLLFCLFLSYTFLWSACPTGVAAHRPSKSMCFFCFVFLYLSLERLSDGRSSA